MNVKKIASFLLMAAMMGSACGVQAQTRKKTTTTKTTTTAKPAPALQKSSIEGSQYVSVVKLMEQANTWMWMFSIISFTEDNMKVDYQYTKQNYDWAVTGNKLTGFYQSNNFLNMTSSNGGLSFKGTENLKGDKEAYLYNINPVETTAEQFKKNLLDGKFYAYLFMRPSQDNPLLGFPVSYKCTMSEDDPNSGVLKVTADNAIMTALGNVKTTFTLADKEWQVKKVFNSSDAKSYEYAENQDYYWIALGSKVIPGGRSSQMISLILIPKK